MANIYFEIQADDPARAAKFYSAIFGWTFSEVTNAPIQYWRIAGNGVMGGMLKRPAKRPPAECAQNAFVCSFEVQKFDPVGEQIVKQGGVVALPKFYIPKTCWQGYFVDTEGNTFGIFEIES
jgi:uncharacterized protein